MDHVPDVAGLIGVGGILVAYVLLQLEKLAPDDISYSLLNAVGAAGILFSLFFEFNLSAAVMEGAWLVVSLYGLARAVRRREPADD